jgi:chalcone isomerase-like protein
VAQVLTGTGIRTRTIARVKVYAFGLYVDPAGARSALGAWRGASASDLRRDQKVYDELLKGSFPMTLRLVMTRDVGADQMASAFEDALAPRLTGNSEALAKFRALFTSDLKNGTELLFARNGSTLKVTIGGQVAGEIDNAVLGWALFDVYLGKKPISKEGKETVLDRLPGILGS